MSVVHFETEVEAPASRVWKVVSSPANLPHWDRHILKVTEAPSNGLRKGSTYTTELGFMGVRAKIGARVIDIDPPHYSKVKLTGLLDATVETWIEPVDTGRSLLRHRIDYRFRGGPIGDVAAQALRMLGAPTLLRRGVMAQKREAESAG